jgi:hypothetical protein
MIKNLLRIKIENVILLVNAISFISILIYKHNNVIYNEIDLIRVNWILIGLVLISLLSYSGIKQIRTELKNRY